MKPDPKLIHEAMQNAPQDNLPYRMARAAIEAVERHYEGRIVEPSLNQCDGCRRGLPVNKQNNHQVNGYAGELQACTAQLYK